MNHNGTRKYFLSFKKVSVETLNQQTPWSRILLDKVTDGQLIKECSPFMGPKGRLPYSQDLVIEPHPYRGIKTGFFVFPRFRSISGRLCPPFRTD
jgi:hypothetical protein